MRCTLKSQLQLITVLKFQKSEPVSVMANTKRKTLDYIRNRLTDNHHMQTAVYSRNIKIAALCISLNYRYTLNVILYFLSVSLYKFCDTRNS